MVDFVAVVVVCMQHMQQPCIEPDTHDTLGGCLFCLEVRAGLPWLLLSCCMGSALLINNVCDIPHGPGGATSPSGFVLCNT